MATDVLGRGIDIERVNIVINYDMPNCSDSYLHRVERQLTLGWKSRSLWYKGTYDYLCENYPRYERPSSEDRPRYF